jgi:hypothetical protein
VRGRRNQREEETGPRNLSTLEASVFYRGSLYIRCSSSANLLFKLPHISITYWWSRRSLLNCKQIHAAPSRSLFPLRSNTNPTTTNPTTPTPQPPPRQHQPHNHHRQHQPHNHHPDNTNPTTTTPTTPFPPPPLQPCYHDHPVKGI